MSESMCLICGADFISKRPERLTCGTAECRKALKARRARERYDPAKDHERTRRGRLARVESGRHRRSCELCSSTFVIDAPSSKAKRCPSCRPQSKPKPTESVIPWASCLLCRGWFIARRRRKQCPDCTPEISRRRTTPVPPGPRVARCKGCGQQFHYEQVTHRVAFCSKRCRMAQPRYKARRRAVKRRRRARKRGALTELFLATSIFERDRWRCQLCGKAVNRAAVVPHPKAPTIDHIVPISEGGDDTRANVQCAHFLCNSRKGDRAERPEQLRLVG